jgi:hypothetical protein
MRAQAAQHMTRSCDDIHQYITIIAALHVLTVLAMCATIDVLCQVMESLRAKTVAALKAGATLALRLGHLTSQQVSTKHNLPLYSKYTVCMYI